MPDPLLEYRQVEVSYGGAPAVRGVSFGLAPARILCIVGESGSGKSTLLRAAMGLLGPAGAITAGDIVFEGRSLPALEPRELRALCGPGMGMVFQDSLASLTPTRTVRDAFRDQARAHRAATPAECDALAAEALARLGVHDPERVLASYPFELSGGLGQRVGIALATMLGPRLVLADEPTSALDAISQRRAVDELARLRDGRGMALVVVTHNIGVARALADDILVLRQGATVEQGPAREVLAHPASPYTAQLIAAAPTLAGGAR